MLFPRFSSPAAGPTGLLRADGIVNHEDLAAARTVLTAAALTYVAATALQVADRGLQVFGRRD
jgi:Zn-dependent membrane protease YugP